MIYSRSEINIKAKFEERLKGFDARGIDLICKLLAFEANERISAFEALDHEYFYDN